MISLIDFAVNPSLYELTMRRDVSLSCRSSNVSRRQTWLLGFSLSVSRTWVRGHGPVSRITLSVHIQHACAVTGQMIPFRATLSHGMSSAFNESKNKLRQFVNEHNLDKM